jgi:hypothetical protein
VLPLAPFRIDDRALRYANDPDFSLRIREVVGD